MTSPPAPNGPGAIARRLVFLGIGILIALIALEVLLRALHLAPAEGVGSVSAKEYERVPGIFTPGQRVRDLQNPGLPYTVTIDSLGFRGPDFPRAKPTGELRILMIGDSYVYGDFVDDDQTLPAQLEQRLRHACPDALVINAGLGGSTIVDQAFMLQRALVLAPDMVVLVHLADHVNRLARPTSSWDQLALNRLKKSKFPLSVFYPLVRHTALWNLGITAWAASVSRRNQRSLHQSYTQDSSATIGRLRERYGEALIAARDTLRRRGISFLLVVAPAWRELQAGSESLTWIEQFADTHGIAWVTPLQAFQASHLSVEQLTLMPKDGHPSRLGYSIAATDLADHVLQDSVLLRTCRQ